MDIEQEYRVVEPEDISLPVSLGVGSWGLLLLKLRDLARNSSNWSEIRSSIHLYDQILSQFPKEHIQTICQWPKR